MHNFLFIPQAVLALAASFRSRHASERTLTGIVVDSGDGATHIIPVVSPTARAGTNIIRHVTGSQLSRGSLKI